MLKVRVGEEAVNKIPVFLDKYIPSDKKIIVVCIGSDDVMPDSVGPLVGTLLMEKGFRNVYGCLNKPIAGDEIDDCVNILQNQHKDDFVIVIEQFVVEEYNSKEIGNIFIQSGPIKPRMMLSSFRFPSIGDFSIRPAMGDTCDFALASRTSLRSVIRMADTLTQSLFAALNKRRVQCEI